MKRAVTAKLRTIHLETRLERALAPLMLPQALHQRLSEGYKASRTVTRRYPTGCENDFLGLPLLRVLNNNEPDNCDSFELREKLKRRIAHNSNFGTVIFNYRTVVCFHPILVTFLRTVRSSLILSGSSPFLAIVLDTQISLSENLLNARTVMEAKLPKKVDRWDGDATNYEAQFNHRNTLGFGDGIIDLTGINQRTISRFQLDPWQQLSLPKKTRRMPVHSHGRTPANLGINGPFPTTRASFRISGCKVDGLGMHEDLGVYSLLPEESRYCAPETTEFSSAVILGMSAVVVTLSHGILPPFLVVARLGFLPEYGISMESALSLSRPSRASSLPLTALRMSLPLAHISSLLLYPLDPILPGDPVDIHLSEPDICVTQMRPNLRPPTKHARRPLHITNH
ncbi:uncharacterized protein EI90DRAFT_3016576 [Cantharellus anzutake]|uniref:uncharacterized protein n=1 Tax=Cantharellus anzutake TaxID=1750568 RepID=UPI001908528C|nr:uncharacterized protein EI90DRAFT_3016576 [Cantharellus anzutake]KAF8330699.1 hypothetical protein EI90DRAFT_3016576 [Cantharellus anzutake]